MELVESLGFVRVKEPTDSEASLYNPEFVKKIQEGKQQVKEGKVTRVKKEDFKSFLGM